MGEHEDEVRTVTTKAYADCLAATLGRLRKATVATADRHFAQAEKQVDIL